MQSNVPVLMVFFNRPDTLSQVFEAVKKARPKKLFLACDGARTGNLNDTENIKKCKLLVENIDWECEVFRNYSEENLGCGKRMSSAISWAFEYVDRLMILEDDIVPSKDFFPFCEEVLEKYKDDQRINMISGMNHIGEHNTPHSYFFCSTGAIWGFATWKRVWDLYQYQMDFLKDQYAVKCFDGNYYPKHQIKSLNKTGENRRTTLENGGKLTAWTYQFRMIRHLYSQLVIVPKVNLTQNIGVSGNATHGNDDIRKVPKGLRCVYYGEFGEISFPLNHPKYIICDTEYDKKLWRVMGNNFFVKQYRKFEGIWRQMIYGDAEKLFSKLLKKAGIKK